MRKIFFGVLLILFLSGCATYYSVRVNDYLDTAQGSAPIPAGASFFVLENKNAKNPILEAEIKSKIENLLNEKGYRITPYEQADFYLSFIYSISSGQSISEVRQEYIPGETGSVQTYKSNGKTSTSVINFPGHTVYVPFRVTVYTSSLTLNILDANSLRNSKEEKELWIGENSSTSRNPDLRDTINYLLAASFEHFGENTGKSIIINIPERDPQVKKIRQEYRWKKLPG